MAEAYRTDVKRLADRVEELRKETLQAHIISNQEGHQEGGISSSAIRRAGSLHQPSGGRDPFISRQEGGIPSSAIRRAGSLHQPTGGWDPFISRIPFSKARPLPPPSLPLPSPSPTILA